MSSAKLFVVGLGVEPSQHATVEGLQALGRCQLVLAAGMTPAQRKALAPYCGRGKIVAVAKGAAEKAAGKRALAELARGKVVALASAGHPFYWSGLAGELVRACKKKGVAWETFGAISPMGVAIAEVGVTLGTDVFGLQSFDYAAVAEKGVALNPEWPLVVYFASPLDRKTYGRAFERLRAFYPAGHAAVWCLAPGARKMELRALEREYARVGSDTVIYLPPKGPPESPLERQGVEWTPLPKGLRAPEWVKE